MLPATTSDLDYLTVRLHARRSRMAEAARLDALCRIHALPEFCRDRYPGLDLATASDFQRRLVQDLADELSACRRHLEGEGHELFTWLVARFQLENLKVLLRGWLNHVPLEPLQPHLISLPADLALDLPAWQRIGSITEFIAWLPPGKPRDRLGGMIASGQNRSQLFLFEAALDSGYFQELLIRTSRLRSEDGEIIRPVVLQETNIFQLMLLVRGRFQSGLAPETLTPLCVPGSGAAGEWFAAMLAASDLSAAVKCVAGIVLDELPAEDSARETSATTDPAAVEALAWKRFLRLANGAFRRSHLGLGAVVGYACLRRLEAANLITVSEGIRTGLPAENLRARLTPRTDLEVAHV